MDAIDKKIILQSVIPMLIIVLLAAAFFLRFGSSGIVLGGSLALTFYVVADIIWSRYSAPSSTAPSH